MKQSASQKNVFQLLDEFDRLENIRPSRDWEQTLFAKMDNPPSPQPGQGSGLKFAALVVFLVLFNAVSLCKLFVPGTSHTEKRSEVLHSISSALLINPVSSN